MSGSSVLVTLNALRARDAPPLHGRMAGEGRRKDPPPTLAGWEGVAMNVLVYLVPLALALGGLGLAAFLWALRAASSMISRAPRGAPSATTICPRTASVR